MIRNNKSKQDFEPPTCLEGRNVSSLVTRFAGQVYPEEKLEQMDRGEKTFSVALFGVGFVKMNVRT